MIMTMLYLWEKLQNYVGSIEL